MTLSQVSFLLLLKSGVNILAWNHKLFPYEIFQGHKLFPKGNCKFVNFQVHFCVDTVCNNSFLCAGVNNSLPTLVICARGKA